MIQSSEESSNEEVFEINDISSLHSKENLSTQKVRASSTNKSISDASKNGSIQTNKNFISGKKSELEMNLTLSNNTKLDLEHNYSNLEEKEKSVKEVTLNNTFQFLKENSNKLSHELQEPIDFLYTKETAHFKNEINQGEISNDSQDSFEEEEEKETQPKIKFVLKKDKESSSDFLSKQKNFYQVYFFHFL